MQKEICFIEAKSPGAHVFSAFPIPRLGTVLLATILKGMGYRTRVFIEDVEPPDWKEVDSYQIIGISTITSTAPRAYKLADRLRARGKTVIMGGPHVTFMPDEALGHCDFVVRGEGEHTVVELLTAIEEKASFEDIKGLSFNSPAGPVHNAARELIADLDPYPAPDSHWSRAGARRSSSPSPHRAAVRSNAGSARSSICSAGNTGSKA